MFQAEDDDFFNEWVEDLPQLSEAEKAEIGRIKKIYDYQRLDGVLLEGTVNLIILSPLLKLAGFFEPPFKIRSPYGIELEITDPVETIRGFIDTLVIQEQLWLLVVESKRNGIPLGVAMPQLLAYMLAQPQSNQIAYGMATNGDEFTFVKLSLGENPRYDNSRTFTLLPRRHELGEVLRVLKRLGQIIT
ncbi:MAG: type I restriction endonuclease subunit R [Cyanobacteria bacterium J06635_10]